MQKLFKADFPCEKDIKSLKILWNTVFGDSKEVVDRFFENTASLENIICVKDGNNVISALYIIDADIKNIGKHYKSMYIYAVATHPDYRNKGLMTMLFNKLFEIAGNRLVSYIFLVPEKEKLFEMYEKSGFETCLFYKKTKVKRCKACENNFFRREKLSYDEYIKYRNRQNEVAVLSLKERGFNSFYNPIENDICVISLENEGYCVYENINGSIIVHELFGNKNALLNKVFTETRKNEIAFYEPSLNCEIPCGMVKVIDDSPKIVNGFFGIPYGG